MTTRIEQKGAARNKARLVVDLFVEETQRLEDHERAAFWDQVRDELLERGCLMPAQETPAPAQCDDMTDAQAEMFGRQAMPFGKHRGMPVAQVPMSYLIWLADNPDHFREDLPAYVRWRQDTTDPVPDEEETPF